MKARSAGHLRLGKATSFCEKPKAENAAAKYARTGLSRVPAPDCPHKVLSMIAASGACYAGTINPGLLIMMQSTPDEKQAIIDYMNWLALDQTVEFLQQPYAENVLNHQHVVWDVCTNVDRWWVITNLTNLYSQEQFLSMDLAVTFHVDLCLRMPPARSPNC
ncbi:hypothetical protein ACKWRH_06105 [Bradyrhizobium sp. Pa8]|uniref:hypothetical protein n=1 Tax=Bradyrhizobium sp. Pa8 TaxID=3386552 RepID=UPI00403F5107